MSKVIEIQSHKGPYSVKFKDSLQEIITYLLNDDAYFIIDAKVFQLFRDELDPILSQGRIIIIQATEHNKSIEQVITFMQELVSNGIRRNHTIIAIGGGIIQDITCFIASTLYRGLIWKFVPTTLLAQADSCIGSKNSINLGKIKNTIGTFNPPKEVLISLEFLETLSPSDIKSGLGEILKVNAIDSPQTFDDLAIEYDDLLVGKITLKNYIEKALLIKKEFIERDEFDKGIRNLFNYGHSFGHAIESATNFIIPHGISVSIGMDIANYISFKRGLITEKNYQRMHKTLTKNYSSYTAVPIPKDDFFTALLRDKKNISNKLVLILAVGDECKIQKVEIDCDELIKNQCFEFLGGIESE